MHMAIAAGTSEPIGQARLPQSILTLLIGAVDPLKLRQREAFLKLVAAARHGFTGICVSLHGAMGARRGASLLFKLFYYKGGAVIRCLDKPSKASDIGYAMFRKFLYPAKKWA